MTGSKSTLAELAQVVLLAALLAFSFNWFSPKGIPLVRRAIPNVAVADSDLFPSAQAAPGDSGNLRRAAPDVKVIAPLHERALAKEDSIGAASPRKEGGEVYRTITLGQLTRLLAEGHYLLLDARDSAAFRKGHIKGARNMFGLATDAYFPDLAPMSRDTLVLIYCNNPECHLGRMLAEFMGAIGFRNLYLYDDGWDGWEKAGMPVDSGLGARP
jgi:rhodanese-related sulfurtransferase